MGRRSRSLSSFSTRYYEEAAIAPVLRLGADLDPFVFARGGHQQRVDRRADLGHEAGKRRFVGKLTVNRTTSEPSLQGTIGRFDVAVFMGVHGSSPRWRHNAIFSTFRPRCPVERGRTPVAVELWSVGSFAGTPSTTHRAVCTPRRIDNIDTDRHGTAHSQLENGSTSVPAMMPHLPSIAARGSHAETKNRSDSQ